MMTIEELSIIIGIVVSIFSIVTPIIKLTKTMAELTIGVQALKDSLNNIIIKNHDAHSRMWDHNKRQDKVINNHDRRLAKVENKLGINASTASEDSGILDIITIDEKDLEED